MRWLIRAWNNSALSYKVRKMTLSRQCDSPVALESFPATQRRMAESKPGTQSQLYFARNRVSTGQYKLLPSSLRSWSCRPACLLQLPRFHAFVRWEQFNGLKTQASSLPDIISADCNYTGGKAMLPRAHAKSLWHWRHLTDHPTQICVRLNILSDLKLCVRVAHCFILNGVLMHEAISCTSGSPEDQRGDELWTTELL